MENTHYYTPLGLCVTLCSSSVAYLEIFDILISHFTWAGTDFQERATSAILPASINPNPKWELTENIKDKKGKCTQHLSL